MLAVEITVGLVSDDRWFCRNDFRCCVSVASLSILDALMARFEPGKGRRRDSEFKPIEVWVDGDNIERAIRMLKRKMADEGVLRELKKRRYYEKPSEAKKRKQREAERRRRKALRKSR